MMIDDLRLKGKTAILGHEELSDIELALEASKLYQRVLNGDRVATNFLGLIIDEWKRREEEKESAADPDGGAGMGTLESQADALDKADPEEVKRRADEVGKRIHGRILTGDR